MISTVIYSQNNLDYDYYEIDFEDSIDFLRIEIDTLLDTNNIWQIARPDKSVFNNAYSGSMAILTDSVGSYPVNDTSSFTIVHTQLIYETCLYGYYQTNTDSILDYGKIEISIDKGENWLDLLKEPSIVNDPWSVLPILTGNSDGWKSFNIGIDLWDLFGGNYHDTLLIKFTFISDSIPSNKDGLMFDFFTISEVWEGISDNHFRFESVAYPNPTKSLLTINFNNEMKEPHKLEIYRQDGAIVFNHIFHDDNIIIDISQYESGVYIYKLTKLNTGRISLGKIIR
jgi:hypothetical protein